MSPLSDIPAGRKKEDWRSDFEIIQGPTRLAAKYDMSEKFRTRLAEIFEAPWPKTLAEWDQIHQNSPSRSSPFSRIGRSSAWLPDSGELWLNMRRTLISDRDFDVMHLS